MKSTRTTTEPFILSERQLAELVLDQMNAAIVICDNQMNIVLANPAAQELHGADPVGMQFRAAFPLILTQRDNESNGASPFSLKTILDGDTLNGRGTLERPGKPRCEVLVHSAPYRGPNDEFLCCIVSMMDITASEEAQERTTNILNAVVEGTTDAIYLKDAAGHFLMINAAGATVMGRPADQVVGKTQLELLDSETARQLRADDERVMEHGKTEVIENVIPSPYGARIFQSVKSPWRNPAGEVIGTIGISRDVTDLREAQAVLARQAALLDLSPDALLMRTLEGKILFWSRGATHLYGWTANQVLGQTTHDLFQTQFLTSRQEQEEALRTQGHWEGELAHRTASGKVVLVASRQLTQYSENGQPAAILEINEDVTERKGREVAQQFLIQATNEFTASLDFDATLKTIARLSVPVLGDWCAVHVLMEDGIIRRLAFAHHDPQVVARVTARPEQYAMDENVRHLVPQVLRTGATEFFNAVPDAVLTEAARDADHLENLRSLGLRAYLCIPLTARGRTLGAVTFAMSDSGRTFSTSDVELAHELVRRAGQAADNARLYQESQAGQTRLQLVAEASSELLASMNYESRLERLAHIVVPRFADWCTINLVEPDGSIRLAALAHSNPEMLPVIQEWVDTHPLVAEAPTGTPNVIRTGKAEWVSNLETLEHSAEVSADRLLYWARLQVRSYMIVPLIARGRVLGSITFVQGASERRFLFQDLLTGEEIARRAAVALDNATLYAMEQNARRGAEENAVRISALQNVTAALASALTPRQVGQHTLEQGVAALGASAGSLSLVSEDKQSLEMLQTQGYDQDVTEGWCSFPINTSTPLAEAIRTGETILVRGEAEMRARYQYLSERQPILYNKAWVAIPLKLESGVIGAIGLTFMQDRDFDAQDRAFMTALSQQAAQAMERAQLYQAELKARADAEQNATRVSALQRITASLGTALTQEQVAEVVLEQGTAALGAQGGLLTCLDEEGVTVEILSAVGYQPETIEANRRFPVDSELAVAEVIRTGKPMAFESPEQVMAYYPSRTTVPSKFCAWLIAPLALKERILGGLTLAFSDSRHFSEADRAFVVALAQQAAQALERAQLFESELAARRAAEIAAQRSGWMTEASHILSSSLDYQVTLKELAQLVVGELSDWCTIDMAKGDGTAEQLVMAHRDPEKLQWAKDYGEEIKQYFEPNWDAPVGLPNVLRTGKSEIYYDIPDSLLEQVTENKVQLEILRGIGYSSVMIVPLTMQNKTLGAITMVNTDSGRHFTDDDLAFAELFAGRAAVAMENARLYRELQILNTELEERVKQRTFELSEAYQELSKEVVERTRAEETTGALLRISNKLNSTLDVETTLELLIQEAIRVMNSSGGFAGLRTPEGMRMHKYFANEKSIPIEYTWEYGEGLPGWVLEHGAPYVTNDAPHDPVMLHELPFNQGVQTAICTPILDAQGKVIGFFELRDKSEGAPFTGADVEFLTALSPIASIAIENAQAYQKISDAESAVQGSYVQIRALAARLQTIREEERTDISRELHDELGQSLTALKMDLAALIGRLPVRSKQLRERAQAMSGQIDETIKTVRRMSSQLRPGMLDDLGLGPSIEWYGHEFQIRTSIEVETIVPPDEIDLPQTQATALFRIFQETLTNVARHANATAVRATLEVGEDMLALQIADNGRGIDLTQARGKRSLGLLGMRERAEMINGQLEIQGEPGKGTTVTVRVPLGTTGQPSNGDSHK